MNVDHEEVLQQSALLIYTVLPCQWLAEIFTKVRSSKPRQHTRKVVSLKTRTLREREGEGKEKGRAEGRERERLAFNSLVCWGNCK